MSSPQWLEAEWPAPPGVRVLCTTRRGGLSRGVYASLNMGAGGGDDPAAVTRNRERLRDAAMVPAEPVWLRQVHGTTVAVLDELAEPAPVADAAVAFGAERVCTVLTADCLPILLCHRDGDRVGAVHAGWRGLAAGVVEAAVARLGDPDNLMAWLGPAIGPDAFEVGPDVRDAFLALDGTLEVHFRVSRSDRWYADLFGLAQARLNGAGVTAVYGGGLCTFHDPARFYSYRRDGGTGRMAALIWRTAGS